MKNPNSHTPQISVKPQSDRQETYSLISIIAYLTGVERKFFEDAFEPPQLGCFLELEQNPDARIIRNLCRLRTAIERNFSSICNAMRYELKNLNDFSQIIPPDCLSSLSMDGVEILQANYRPDRYLMDINRQIAERIHLCKVLFPIWLNWDYIRELFIMPKGDTPQGLKRAATMYYGHLNQYPYQVYINWIPGEDGNLYERHHDQFLDISKVSTVSETVKDDIYRFLEESSRATVIVDCENADPYKLYAMLTGLNRDALLDRVKKIILYNDTHTSSAWKILNQFTDIPVEHYMTERIKAEKSLVDIQLAAGLCREHYENNTDAFILLSSDSDYWGVITSVPQIRFLVMLEESKCSPAMKSALTSGGIPFCIIDNFCTSGSSKIMFDALNKEVSDRLRDTKIKDLNIRVLLEQAYLAVRANMTAKEKQRFFDRCVKSLRIVFAYDGQPVIQMG